jgi:acyl CoA:acetate/3-ketoacid CoA transferase beta subunit
MYTPDEIMVVCISRQIEDGELVIQGLATPLIAAAYLLARRTHAPHLYFASAIGQSVCREPAPLGLSRVESLWLDRSLTSAGFVRVVADILPRLRPKEFFRPAQVDPAGNFNNIAFGKGYVDQPATERRPRLRLPGSGGIPDVTTFLDDIYLYVPRHSRATFVPTLDVLSGLGHHPARTHGQGPVYLVTNLGQFDFAGTDHKEDAASYPPRRRMRLLTYHPGSSIEQVRAHTGFELEIAPGAGQTPEPTAEEIRILREEIDPLGIRRLEAMSGAPRHQLLREILKMEK